MVANANLALRFLLELAGIVALGWWGVHLADGAAGIVLGIGAAVLLIVVWGLVVAPRARYPQSPRFRLVAGTVLLEATALALAAGGATPAAVALGVAVLVNAIGLAAAGEGGNR
ncbi:MAG TPA: YrdB family protein [Candidatus Deferrimicrobium sp.]|nr:YrdB family protein [Candidatus Deferrimicrobium sp.]